MQWKSLINAQDRFLFHCQAGSSAFFPLRSLQRGSFQPRNSNSPLGFFTTLFVAPQFEPNTHSWKKPGTFTALRPSVWARRRSRSCASGSSEPLSHYKYHKENWKQIFKWLSGAELSTVLPQVQVLLSPKCFPPGLNISILLCCVGRGTKSPAVPYQLGCSHAGSDELRVISQPSLSQLHWALLDPSSTTAAQELIKFKFLPSCRLLLSLHSTAISL